ncbi:MAG: O-antigen polymerase, partial [Verrucomicrobiales bacterium]|nr:O-antigen polymerase [Verrucomicrobiales bacterium]
TILLLVAGIFAYAFWAIGVIQPRTFVIVQLLTCGALALWGVRILLIKSYRLLWPPLCWLVVAFVVYSGICYHRADVEYVARLEFIRILVYAALFFLIVNNFRTQSSAQLFTFFLIVLATLVACYGIYQYASSSHQVFNYLKPLQYGRRASGNFINPNHLAGFLEMIIPFTFAWALSSRFHHATRLVLGYVGLVMCVGLVLTISRGGWVSCTVSMVLLLILLIGRKQSRISATLLLLLLLLFGGLLLDRSGVFSARASRDMQILKSDDVRFKFWKPAVEIWKRDPWLGNGPGHYDILFATYRPTDVQIRPEYVHNDYLNTLCDYGIIGLIIILSGMAVFYYGLWKTWPFVQRQKEGVSQKGSNRAGLILGAGVGIFAILVHSFVDFNMHMPANAMVVVAILALATTYQRYATERVWTAAPMKYLALMGIIAFCLYLVPHGLQTRKEQNFLLAAKYLPFTSQERIAALKDAFAVESKNSVTAYDLGEALWKQSLGGYRGYEVLARESMEWSQKSVALNPHEAQAHIGVGLCLDWLDQHQAAAPYYMEGLKHDPNGYSAVAYAGYHEVQAENYPKAIEYFKRSLELKPSYGNPVAYEYLGIISKRMSEKAGNP